MATNDLNLPLSRVPPIPIILCFFGEIVLYVAKGKSLDMMEAMPHWGSDSFMEGYTVGPNGENYERGMQRER